MIEDNKLVDSGLDKIITQYRESPNLLFLIATYLRQLEMVHQSICELPEKFNLSDAEGDQLTLIGKRLGWGRCHCVCSVQPVFGFSCDGYEENYPIAGFCDENVTWVNCGEFGFGDVCINDDELYRKFLKVRRYQIDSRYDLESLSKCVKILFGPSGEVIHAGHGKVIIAPGRPLQDVEVAILQLYPRILPLAPGIEARFHFGQLNVFGFGEGWGGFCEQTNEEGFPLQATNDLEIHTEYGVPLVTGVSTTEASWMCQFDVNPYSCG